jgi:serine/threonine-protein kinase
MRLLGAHPNLIVTGDMFAWDDNKFVLPTEFIEDGQTLEQMLARGAEDELTWARKAELAIKVAHGLQHAHKNGVVHRDVRPLNVVVAPGGVVKLVNFDLGADRGVAGLQRSQGARAAARPRLLRA